MLEVSYEAEPSLWVRRLTRADQISGQRMRTLHLL